MSTVGDGNGHVLVVARVPVGESPASMRSEPVISVRSHISGSALETSVKRGSTSMLPLVPVAVASVNVHAEWTESAKGSTPSSSSTARP